MFQGIAAVFLDIAAFIFDFPLDTTSWVGECASVLGRDDEIGDPLKTGRLRLAVGGLLGFQARSAQDRHGVFSPGAVDIDNVIDPAQLLFEFERAGRALMNLIVGRESGQRPKLGGYRGQISVLQHDQILPAVCDAQGKGRPASKQPIQQQAEGQERKARFEAGGQAVKRLQFAGPGSR